MKKIFVFAILLFTLPVVALGDDTDALNLNIKITTGERGRDSSSTTKSIAISGGTIVYKVTHGGRNRGRLPEQNKEFKLEGTDQQQLAELLKVLNPSAAESIDRDVMVKGNSYYFALSISQEIDGKMSTLSIKGQRHATDIAQLKQYKDAIALIEAVYAIMYRTDKEISYEELIRMRIKRG